MAIWELPSTPNARVVAAAGAAEPISATGAASGGSGHKPGRGRLPSTASLAGMESGAPIRVGVLGAAGRMGRTACRAVDGADGLILVAAADPAAVGEDLDGVADGIVMVAGPTEVVAAGAEVVVDFTVVDASRANLPILAEAGVHAVVGTSGLDGDDLAGLRASFTSSNCVVVPNFAIGAVLMMRFAEIAAPWFDTAEVLEFHHDGKADAPSGTALATADRMAAASADWAADGTMTENLSGGGRGAKGPSGIRIHAVRMRGMVAHQEVVLGTTGQTLTIRHDTVDRDSFMPGVLLAVRRIAEVPGVTVGLDALLGL